MSKLIYLIRHGVAQHNDNFLKYGKQTFYDPKFKDTHLTSIGELQSKRLNSEWTNIDDVELVLISPLYRTLQTANNIFMNKDIQMLSLEDLREYPMGKHTCNMRSNRKILKNDFPNINFNLLVSDSDILWDPNTEESITSLEYRIEKIKEFIKNRTEDKICIISHTAFIEKMKDNKISLLENNENEIKHCYPYQMNL